ncbi:hypothetical protein C8Q77DRAFT_261251 [Trametes polyzona]|nr:hypothetical protein C8Q77DRAFT_261251 [Trametes polyzona]
MPRGSSWVWFLELSSSLTTSFPLTAYPIVRCCQAGRLFPRRTSGSSSLVQYGPGRIIKLLLHRKTSKYVRWPHQPHLSRATRATSGQPAL